MLSSTHTRVDQILASCKLLENGKGSELRSLIPKCLNDLIVNPEQVEVEANIGRGSSSEVFSGSYLYCPVAVKKIHLEGYSEKQLVDIA
jgi:hypothetical protein